MIDITIPMLAPSLNKLIRMHFREYGKIRDNWTWLVREQAGNARSGPQFTLDITRYYAVHPLDLDAMYARKLEIDALRDAGIIPDDDPNSLIGLKCQQFKVKTRKEECTRIIIQ